MKPFKSFMAPLFEQYLCYRKSLGYSGDSARYGLVKLDNYLIAQRAAPDQLQHPLFFLKMRQSLTGEPRTINGIISTVRGFFEFLVRNEVVAENPLNHIPDLRQNAYIPFVFSLEQTRLLLDSVQNSIRRQQPFFLQDQAVFLALKLIADCGLRIREPLNLLTRQYDPQEKTIYIEKTKFKKDRLLPIPDQVNLAVKNYLALKQTFLPQDQPQPEAFLLTGLTGRRLPEKDIYAAFHQALQSIGLDNNKRHTLANITFGAPTPHSLRHSFAINTLNRILNRGGSAQNALPILSMYMGHCKYRYTALYLKVIDAKQRTALVDFNITHQQEQW